MLSNKIERFKKWWKEDHNDYAEGIIHPKQFYEVFYFYSRIFYLLDDEYIPKWKKYVPRVLFVNSILADFVCLLGFYNALRQFEIILIAEMGAYVIIFTYNFLIQVCLLYNVPSYRHLSQSMIDDYQYVCTTGQRYRTRYFTNQIETRKICTCCAIFIITIGGSMVLFTILLLVVFFIRRDPDGDEKRSLLFPLWVFDRDMSATPYFEIFFVYTDIMIVTCAFSYAFSLQTMILWVRQMCAKVDLMIYCMEDLCEGIEPAKSPEHMTHNNIILKPRLAKIIKHHHSLIDCVQDYADVYKKLFMLGQKLISGVVCFTAFGSAEKLAEGEVHFVLILVGFTAALEVFMSSYICTILGLKIRSIMDAAVNVPFWTTGPIVRPYLVLMMQRSMRPLPLQAPGFDDISLQTFSSKMVSAYSLFNTLRQTDI